MDRRDLENLPTPPLSDVVAIETATNGAGQEVYRVVMVSEWEVIPGR
jgi:hypothetical protein